MKEIENEETVDGCGGLTPDALKKFAEERKSCQMKTIFHNGLVCLGNNKLGSLRQSNSVWCVANWTGYAHPCFRYFGRGFSYARDLESLHAVCAVVESFHRAILSQPAPPSSIISKHDMGRTAQRTTSLSPVAGEVFLLTIPFIERA